MLQILRSALFAIILVLAFYGGVLFARSIL
jgi:hypothetical protein